MTLLDYINTTKHLREQYINSITSVNGLSYFGGKSRQIKQLYNHIFNLIGQMYVDGNQCTTLVDAFTGGGKIGLTIPTYGWVDKIVMNDLDEFIYSYYKTSKENPAALIKMIEQLGKVMCEDLFYVLLYDLNNNKNNKNNKVKFDELGKAAIIYWVTEASWDNHTDSKAQYSLKFNNEEQNIRNIIIKAKDHISKISKKLNSKNRQTGEDIYILRNEKYEDIINEYNNENTLFYFDPPYYQFTLANGEEAHYKETFSPEMTEIMTGILAKGDISYFIKSDYDPKYTLFQKYNVKSIEEFDTLTSTSDEEKKAYHIFDPLEEEPFGKILLGTYDKSTCDGQNLGHEYIWCNGFKPDYYKQAHTS